MKNLIFTIGIVLHLAIAQWSYVQAGRANTFRESCGGELVRIDQYGAIVDCENPYKGQYDLYLSIAWTEAALLFLALAFLFHLNLANKLLAGFFAYSTWCNFVDQIDDPFKANWVLDTLSISAYGIFAVIISLKSYQLWKKNNG